MDYVKRPIRAATSPTAKRTYLGTLLFAAASLVLLAIAALAYPVFYYSYIPKKLVTIPVHLQYNTGLNPYGITHLSPNLMLEQSYDVSVELTVPRSPPNMDRGNFMVAVYAMRSLPDNPAFAFSMPEDPYAHVTQDNVVFSSRRPVLIPYRDPLVTSASRLIFLLYHIFFPAADTATLVVPMAEMVEFKGMLPLSLLLDVQAGQTLQVYSATVTLVARLSGIRWAMYNHRILSFLVCTAVFWICEMISMAVAWILIAYCLSGGDQHLGKGKKAQLAGREDSWNGGYSSEDEKLVARRSSSAGRPALAEKPRRGSPGPGRDPGSMPKLEDEGEGDDKTMVKREDGEDPKGNLAEYPRHQGGDADDEEDGDEVWREAEPGSSGFQDGKGGSLRRRASRGRS